MGVCMCSNKTDEGKFYIEFINSLKIKTIKSEELIKKLKEKYLTVSKEDKKKAALLNDIIPMIESEVSDYREISHNLFMEYFEENKKKFYALCFFCDKESKESMELLVMAIKLNEGLNKNEIQK